MKRLLFLLFLALAGAAVVCGSVALYLIYFTQGPEIAPAQSEPPAAPLRPAVDVDAMAGRMKDYQDVYKKLCDESLAAYAKRHPGQHSYDEQAKMTIKLAAYLWVWGDFYGEDLPALLDNYSDYLCHNGCPDPLWDSFTTIYFYRNRYSNTDENIRQISQSADAFAATEYPAAYKLDYYKASITNMVNAKEDPKIQPPLKMDRLPVDTESAIRLYRELEREKIPEDRLLHVGILLQNSVQDDEQTLQKITAGLRSVFPDNAGQTSTASAILDGNFQIDDAWNARGGGWANTVTSEGWRLFGERLALANTVLTNVYAQHPDNRWAPYLMMTVVLGQQQPHDQMELWFQRGLAADPNNYSLYMSKCNYLLPRWYGSDEELIQFGLECAKSDNWYAKIPFMLAECTKDPAENDPEIYAKPEIWSPLEKVFRGYLDHYPNSIHARTFFAKCAAGGGHWDIVREQLTILGNYWDRDVLNEEQYAALKKLAAAKGR